jgi:hypothetical protein
VNNCSDNPRKYIVARFIEATHDLWYYGSWDDLMTAQKAVEEIPNGIIVERID